MSTKFKKIAAAAAFGMLLAPAANALTLEISITNTAAGGLTLTPLYTAFHDGTFDTFDVGGTATPGLEALAEDGNFMPIAGERMASNPSAQGAVVTAPGGFAGAPVIENGETGTTRVTVDGSINQFFSFLSMILPSNDQFIGNDDPMAHQLFDNAGNFLGSRTFDVFGTDVYDAGTEQNTATGAPFIPGLDPTALDEGGTITAGAGVANFDGLTLANGQVFNASLADFAGSSTYQIASISVTAVPVPAALPLMGGALVLMGAVARRRKASKA